MSIIEEYKRKAHQIVSQAKAKLAVDDEEDSSNNNTIPLIQEIDESMNKRQEPQTDYQSEQFEYFANLTTSKETKCRVCGKKAPKYTCPKCKVRYCSVDHYKTHNLFCTEKFFKEQVELQLKATRAPKEQKKKMIQTLKQHQQEMATDSDNISKEVKVEEIREKRLLQIVESLEQGKEINLNEGELKSFQAYLRQIEQDSLQQSVPTKAENINKDQCLQQKPFQEYHPYWLISQGLSQYWNMTEIPSLEEYQGSPHQQTINYRQLAAQLLRQELTKLIDIISISKASVFVNFDMIQVVYLTSLLFRCYNGEYLNNSEFVETWLMIYDQKLSKNLSEALPNHQIATIKTVNIVSLIKAHIASVQNLPQQTQQLIQSWLPIAAHDCQAIFKNKYICLETLFRLVQGFRSVSGQTVKWKDQIMAKEPQENKTKSTKQQKQQKRLIEKTIKKLEYLMVFGNEILYCIHTDTSPQEPLIPIKQIDNLKLIETVLERQCNQEHKREQQQAKINEMRQREKESKLRGIFLPTF